MMRSGRIVPRTLLTPFLLLFVAILGPAGCSTAGIPPSQKHSWGTLQPEAWENLQYSDSYHVVQRLRPSWLNGRRAGSYGLGTQHLGESQVQVYVDGMLSPFGVGCLKAIPAQDILEIQHLGPTDATLHYGTNHGAGAILVVTKAGAGTGRT